MILNINCKFNYLNNIKNIYSNIKKIREHTKRVRRGALKNIDADFFHIFDTA